MSQKLNILKPKYSRKTDQSKFVMPHKVNCFITRVLHLARVSTPSPKLHSKSSTLLPAELFLFSPWNSDCSACNNARQTWGCPEAQCKAWQLPTPLRRAKQNWKVLDNTFWVVQNFCLWSDLWKPLICKGRTHQKKKTEPHVNSHRGRK